MPKEGEGLGLRFVPFRFVSLGLMPVAPLVCSPTRDFVDGGGAVVLVFRGFEVGFGELAKNTTEYLVSCIILLEPWPYVIR